MLTIDAEDAQFGPGIITPVAPLTRGGAKARSTTIASVSTWVSLKVDGPEGGNLQQPKALESHLERFQFLMLKGKPCTACLRASFWQ